MDLSDSDDDEFQLYTRSEENFLKKRSEIKAKRRELENVIDLMTENEVDIALNDENFTCPPLITDKSNISKPTPDSSPIRIEDISDSDENIPLSELSRNLRRSKRHRPRQEQSPQQPKRRPGRPKRNSRRQNKRGSSAPQIQDEDVIVFDDDTGYEEGSLPPIDFNSRNNKKSRLSYVPGNISLENVLNDDLNEDDLIENDDIVTLTIEWNNGQKTTRKQFKLRRYQKFESVFEELAKMENISSNRVLLMYDFKSVNPTDTPSSLNLKFYGALLGSVSKNEINRNKGDFVNEDNEKMSGTNGCIQVKLLLQSKQALLLTISSHQKMEVLYKKCAEEVKCDRSLLKLTFDGEYVEPSDLVSDLDIEDGDVFHVHIKSS